MRRTLAVAALCLGVVACNAIAGYGGLHKVDDSTVAEAGAGKTSAEGGKISTEAGPNGPPLCDLTKPFGAPGALKGPINAASAYQLVATLTDDELTIIVGRINGPVDGELLVATRNSFDEDFPEPSPIPILAGANRDFGPTITGDGLNLYFIREVTSGQDILSSQIMTMHRASRTAEFTAPETVLESSDIRLAPFISSDGAELYFAKANSNTDTQIWRAVRGDENLYGAPAPVSELAASGQNGGVALSPDGLRIYFASNRTGAVGPNDTYTATRTQKDQPWTGVTKVTELNSASSDRPDWVSPDGCRIYMGSERDANGTIYVASRPAL